MPLSGGRNVKRTATWLLYLFPFCVLHDLFTREAIMDGIAVKKVLILDDDLAVGNTLGMILKGEKYDVRVVYSAESALALVADWTPNIAIVDVLLPGMNGVDFAVILEKACPGCRVLLFTALPGLIDVVEAARTEGHPFEVIEKPISPLFMLNRVADLLALGPNTAFPLPA